MKHFVLFLAVVVVSGAANAAPPAAGNPILDDAFDREELGEGWNLSKGEWKIVGGVLRAREIPADEHAGAARRVMQTRDALFEFRFRFIEKGEGFHFGFDPGKGELEKKGHLFSVIVAPTSWKIVKHPDKARPKEDPTEILASADTDFETGVWYTLKVTTSGDHVTVEIDGKKNLEAEHPTFHVMKPTLVFRCIGDGVEIDDLKVWTLEKKG